jgi:antitoxin component YwqK of YwqJK toxin-antitoxin module
MLSVRYCALAVVCAAASTVPAAYTFAEELPFPPPRPSLKTLEQIQGALSKKPAAQSGIEQGELITERYPNGAVRLQRYVIQDADRNYVNHGSWTMLDPQGQVIAQGEYRNGKEQGPWMRVMTDFPGVMAGFQGPYISQAEFDNGELHGTWTIIDAKQHVVGSWQFSRGELDGPATTWYPGGRQRREMTFSRGIPDGESTAWKPNGQIAAREFYRDGKQLIPVVTWHNQQQKESEGWMVRSNFTINAKVDWWNGKIEITRSETEGTDVKTGKWTEWYANGTVKFEGMFEEGVAVDQHVWWHPNGQKMLAGTYDSGMQEGRWTEWHATGMKQVEGDYLAGRKTGTWTTWAEDGLVADVQHIAPDTGSGRRSESGIAISKELDDAPHNVSHLLAP